MSESTLFLRNYVISLYQNNGLLTSTDELNHASTIIDEYITGSMTFQNARSQLSAFTSITQPIDKLQGILEIQPDPIPYDPSQDLPSARRKSRSWSAYEDMRLLSAIYQFGIENWTSISRFVGNGRTRSQCSQRWYRGLDPSISKDQWTPEEENRLVELVTTLGDKSWTKIATNMSHRTDVQCRYRYRQIVHKAEHSATPSPQALTPTAVPLQTPLQHSPAPTQHLQEPPHPMPPQQQPPVKSTLKKVRSELPHLDNHFVDGTILPPIIDAAHNVQAPPSTVPVIPLPVAPPPPSSPRFFNTPSNAPTPMTPGDFMYSPFGVRSPVNVPFFQPLRARAETTIGPGPRENPSETHKNPSIQAPSFDALMYSVY